MSVLTHEKVEDERDSPAVSQLQNDRFSFSTDEDVVQRRIWRKLDFHLLPLTALLYLLCFL
jgi:hypothetical protein